MILSEIRQKSGSTSPDKRPGDCLLVEYSKGERAPDAAAGLYVLGAVEYTVDVDAARDETVARVPLRAFPESFDRETWLSTEPVDTGCMHNICYRANENFLFGVWQPNRPPGTIDSDTSIAYGDLIKFLDCTSHKYLVRVWNYLPDINSEIDGLECYKRFCQARHETIFARQGTDANSLPAASAVGCENGQLTLFFLASRHRGEAVENPKQVSAYKYPAQYGPRSPSFSRGMVTGSGQNARLFISGTASIRGHETWHKDDLSLQLNVTLENIDELLLQANKACGSKLRGCADLALLKVYIRNEQDYWPVRTLLEDRVPGVPIMYLHADICRSDLLLEIEGLSVPSA
ncbi:MAG: hypothetical protein OEZ10_09185 [Gammaproteobacteria bacterium]|nr:hypothetical protein [Gammaproteobacteria bacterium]